MKQITYPESRKVYLKEVLTLKHEQKQNVSLNNIPKEITKKYATLIANILYVRQKYYALPITQDLIKTVIEQKYKVRVTLCSSYFFSLLSELQNNLHEYCGNEKQILLAQKAGISHL